MKRKYRYRLTEKAARRYKSMGIVLILSCFVIVSPFLSHSALANAANTIVETTFKLTRNMRMGMRGEDVKLLQELLSQDGYFNYHTATGYFGEITRKAVIDFQKAKGLKVDGIAGPQTWTALAVERDDANTPTSRGDVDRSKTTENGTGQEYIVKRGDSLWKISQQFKVPITKLVEVNNIKNGSLIYVNQKLIIPSNQNTINVTIKDAEPDTTGKQETDTKTSQNKAEKEKQEAPKTQDKANEKKDETPKQSPIEVLDWKDANKVFSIGTVATVIDTRTGISYKVKRTYGSLHADTEPLTKEDADTMRSIWRKYETVGKSTNYWARRPIILVIGDRRLAASANGMFHAGVDSKPANVYVNNRSGGYGYGQNLDAVKGNGADGHFCIHFVNSKTHGTKQVDASHQAAIKEAAKYNK